uniref:Vesicle transport protein n=1 Tax=Heterorhabditis bacteriophora TaxID=37862 RepID=A0A1I7WAT0_HETBA
MEILKIPDVYYKPSFFMSKMSFVITTSVHSFSGRNNFSLEYLIVLNYPDPLGTHLSHAVYSGLTSTRIWNQRKIAHFMDAFCASFHKCILFYLVNDTITTQVSATVTDRFLLLGHDPHLILGERLPLLHDFFPFQTFLYLSKTLDLTDFSLVTVFVFICFLLPAFFWLFLSTILYKFESPTHLRGILGVISCAMFIVYCLLDIICNKLFSFIEFQH